MPGAVAARDPVAILGAYDTLGVDQYRAERFIPCFQGLGREFHAAAQVPHVSLVNHRSSFPPLCPIVTGAPEATLAAGVRTVGIAVASPFRNAAGRGPIPINGSHTFRLVATGNALITPSTTICRGASSLTCTPDGPPGSVPRAGPHFSRASPPGGAALACC